MSRGRLPTAYYPPTWGGHTGGKEGGFVRPGSKPPPPLPYLRPVPCINSGPKKGHGVGMCQWGAHDMAARGDSYVAILEHYYTGITISSEPEADTGLIQGAVTDQARQPMADVLLRLTREGWSEEVTSGSDGEYRFTQLPPAIYNLRAIDHDVERVGLPLSAGQKMTVDLNIPVAEGEWTMQLERKPGLPLLVGSMSRTGIEVTLQTPMDTTFEASSGSKPEYGMGGFEFWAPLRGTYQIQFLDQTFEIPMNGQFTHAAFTETSDEPTGNGVIHGVLRDQDGAVQAGRQITLTGPDLSRTVATDGNGSYRFGQLPASTYVLRVAGTPLSRQVHSTGRSPVTVDLELLPASAGQWLMKVTRMSGSPMIAGNLPEADIPVTVTSPSGPITRVVSGSKPEHGVGGFEVGAPQRGSYTIQFLDQTFNLPVDGRFTRIILIRGTHPIESQANIVSQTMPMSQAHDWLQYFESDPKTRGVFQVDES
ncbi:MAG: carboxypeptidase regulatory-like domain-containing protein [Ardenticatenia bacterium]|nr:carboxypeptidase regulatory-like domain-containing protein [Ardenticatenia bacterium]